MNEILQTEYLRILQRQKYARGSYLDRRILEAARVSLYELLLALDHGFGILWSDSE